MNEKIVLEIHFVDGVIDITEIPGTFTPQFLDMKLKEIREHGFLIYTNDNGILNTITYYPPSSIQKIKFIIR